MEKLICPACEHELTEITFNGLTVDICQNGCGGIWFYRKELENVDEKHEQDGLILFGIEKNPAIQLDQKKIRFCPRCKDVKLRKHFWSVKAQVEIDECDKCNGLWLDDGELEKIRNLYENEAEKIADQSKYFKQLSYDLIDQTQEIQREQSAWYDKLAYTIFGV